MFLGLRRHGNPLSVGVGDSRPQPLVEGGEGVVLLHHGLLHLRQPHQVLGGGHAEGRLLQQVLEEGS